MASTRTEIEAYAFRQLVAHLQARTNTQNIDMMNLAGFCRNCLSRWYREAAVESGLDMDDKADKDDVLASKCSRQSSARRGGDEEQLVSFLSHEHGVTS